MDTSTRFSSEGWEVQLFQDMIAEPRHPDTLQILADGTQANAATLANVTIAPAAFVFQSYYFSSLAHR
jgi:hypothetical protein